MSKRRRDALAVTSFILFVLLMIKDIMLALVFTSVAYIVISKVEVEKFDTKIKNIPKKDKETVEKPSAKKEPEKKGVTEEKQEKEVEFPEHCKDNDLDKEFLKQYEIDVAKLESVQTNVFDKYNYNVFYNELGENSLDIQGIHNHEVIGYEK
tara:strand:- start:94 stop:549 length:456 start_codon:yes stop_codon:yes gene_type:complete